MLTEYRLDGDAIVSSTPSNLDAFGPGTAWIDAFCPDEEELSRLGELMGFELPNRHDMTEIELSSRLYREGDSYVMIANLLPKSATEILPPRPAAFILRRDLLLTIRFCEFYSFERVGDELIRNVESGGPQAIFCNILEEAKSDRADDLEFSMCRLEELTSRLFLDAAASRREDSSENVELEAALVRIGGMGERISNIRESIGSMQRVLNFVQNYVPQEWMKEEASVIRALRNDLTALSDEASFFMNKLSFNLDATLGMINIEETKIMRVLSVVTLVLSPPVLIAGVYGMNFQNMPELSWPFGYGFAIVLMIATALAPLWYLKRKKWL
jgi:magnesium transporter